MKEIIDVNTGHVAFGEGNVTLRSVALGSCIAVVAYNSKKKTGVIAHIMLPGKAPENSLKKTKYAADAIEEMIDMMLQDGSQKGDIEVCLAGAGNVLQKEDDTICAAIIKSTTQLLNNENIPIRGTTLGGTKRRSIFLDVESGAISCTIGDEREKDLWKPMVS